MGLLACLVCDGSLALSYSTPTEGTVPINYIVYNILRVFNTVSGVFDTRTERSFAAYAEFVSMKMRSIQDGARR